MPKIIENVREKLVDEARRQVAEQGYARTTIRSIAGACGLAGIDDQGAMAEKYPLMNAYWADKIPDFSKITVPAYVTAGYNYFPSKDVLFATFMLQDWGKCLEDMKSFATEDVRAFLGHVCGCLEDYIRSHMGLLYDKDASVPYAAAFPERHAQLRGQIAEVLAPVCEGREPFLAEFVAESLLSWTSAGKPFEEQYSVLRLLFER